MLGESKYDAHAVCELILALCPDAEGRVKPLRNAPRIEQGMPLSLRSEQARRIAALIDAERAEHPVACVFLHADCDAVEPAHEARAREIRDTLAAVGGHGVHPVTPAWELEAWWFLWPEAVPCVKAVWRQPDQYRGKNVGLVVGAKERFRQSIRRSPGARSRHDYCEADAPRIAQKVRELGLVRTPRARSTSFECFVREVESCCARCKS